MFSFVAKDIEVSKTARLLRKLSIVAYIFSIAEISFLEAISQWSRVKNLVGSWQIFAISIC